MYYTYNNLKYLNFITKEQYPNIKELELSLKNQLNGAIWLNDDRKYKNIKRFYNCVRKLVIDYESSIV